MDSSRALRSYGTPGFGGIGQFGGAFLLINALSSKIYELIAEASQVVSKGYEDGGVIGLVRSSELRTLLRRYLWLLSLVFAYERIRWLWSFLNGFKALTKYLYIDATLRTGDQAYEWMLAYWEHSSSFRKKSRDFIVETGSVLSKRRAAQAILHGGGESIYLDAQVKTDADMQTRITPKDEAEQWFFNEGTVFRLRRRMQTTPPNWMMGTEAYQTPVITIRSYSLTRKPLFKLLKEAKAVYERTRPQMITIRVLDMRGTWRKVAYKARRPLSSIIMDDDKRASLLRDAQEFLNSEDWYAARGLRWNRGYLLHGAPGTGKSSTIQALASEIKLDVYIISITSNFMNDATLTAAMRSIPPKSIVVIEDVDAIFSTQKRELNNTGPAQAARAPPTGMYPGMRMSMGGHGGGNISLSAALNAIDGVESNEGRLLMMSTNVELAELDAALTRPGRVDMYINYKRATQAQAEELFNIFYRPTQHDEPDIEELVVEEDSIEEQSQKSIGKLLPTVLPGVGINPAEQKAAQRKSNAHHPFDLPAHVTQAKIGEWAKLWADVIEDEQFTIAELQGMLLAYKKDPEAAMKIMPDWIAQELARKKAEAEKERLKQEEAKAQAAAAAAAPAASVNGVAADLTSVTPHKEGRKVKSDKTGKPAESSKLEKASDGVKAVGVDSCPSIIPLSSFPLQALPALRSAESSSEL